MKTEAKCTDKERMTIHAARLLKPYNGKHALVGIGLPVLASQLARILWCPEMITTIENGSFDANIPEIPFSLFAGRISYKCSAQLDDSLALAGAVRGTIDIGFLGAGQLDKYGNINTTQVGPIENPRGRIAGSGGAVDIGAYCNTVIIAAQSKRDFREQVDYVTTPGWVCPDNTQTGRPWVRRETLGLKGGPMAIVTNLGIMRFDEQTKIAYLSEYYPGVTIEQVLDNTAFDIDVSRAKEADPVTEQEVEILRTKVDPMNLYGTR